MSDIFEKAIVQKQNILNEIRANNLTLQELRFFSIYLSKINSRDISTRTVKFKLADFQKIMNFKELKISQLRSATDSLLTKLVHLPKESGGYSTFQLFKKCDVDKDETGEWFVLIDAHDDAGSFSRGGGRQLSWPWSHGKLYRQASGMLARHVHR